MKKTFIAQLLLLFMVMAAQAQTRNISGRVTDKTGSGLAGVSVSVKGTSNGAQTNQDGAFSLSNVESNATLQISFVGYKTYETKIPANGSVNVVLEEEARQLNEVIITANAIPKQATSLGYATTTIKNDELTRGRDRSVLNALQGKVAGVQITNTSGGVGASTRIVFRGGTSLSGANQPLIVVDGIPIDNSQVGTGDNLNNQVDAGNRGNDVNPDDIESVTVLKGPGAAALYGSRASNGALIITTKSGKLRGGKKSEISVSSSYNFESILRLPKFQNEYGQGGHKEYDSRENFSWGPKFDGKMRPWGQQVGDSQRVKPWVGLEDNVKEFFDIGRTFSNSVSLSQSNDKSSYFLSIGDVDQKGVMPGTEYKRTSVKVAGATELSHNAYSSISVNYIHSTGDLSVQGQGTSPYDQVLQTPRDISLLDLKDYRNKFNDLAGYYGAYTVNPWYTLGEDAYKTQVDRILGNFTIGIKPVKWLDIQYRLGTDFSADKRRQIVSKRTITDDQNQNFGNSFKGKYEETSINLRRIESDLMVTAKRDLTKDLSLSVLVGQNVNQVDATTQISTANALVVPNVYNLSNADGDPTTNNAILQSRRYGVYTDINLGYKNYLFLGLTARNDWSSTLTKGNNSYFYPSANLSFLFTEFIKIPTVISYGKVRASVARVGNDAPPYALKSVFVTGTITDGFQNSQVNFPLNDVPGYTTGNLIGNPGLTPEFTTSYEVGLEMSFLNDRIGLDMSLYSNISSDQILVVPIAATSGYTAQYLNAGTVTNKGIELMLRGQPIRSRNFSWEITGTYTKNKNLVKELYEGTDQISLGGFTGATLVAKVGEPFGSFFGSGFLRDPNGNVVVDAATGYPRTDPIAKTHGHIQPDFLASLANTFTYEGFSLYVLFDAKKGGKFFSRTKSLQEFVGTDPKTLYNDREAFVIPGSVVEMPDGKFVTNTVPVTDAQ
ncbi:MAG: SusC/RagA family TonB-linked outer membrane protein, partial [Gemmatimonadaceae bacterium]|nr:SusC/RagA family TonB-linked outer membrane protein [Chitinophagaceae bacterium]